MFLDIFLHLCAGKTVVDPVELQDFLPGKLRVLFLRLQLLHKVLPVPSPVDGVFSQHVPGGQVHFFGGQAQPAFHLSVLLRLSQPV